MVLLLRSCGDYYAAVGHADEIRAVETARKREEQRRKTNAKKTARRRAKRAGGVA